MDAPPFHVLVPLLSCSQQQRGRSSASYHATGSRRGRTDQLARPLAGALRGGSSPRRLIASARARHGTEPASAPRDDAGQAITEAGSGNRRGRRAGSPSGRRSGRALLERAPAPRLLWMAPRASPRRRQSPEHGGWTTSLICHLGGKTALPARREACGEQATGCTHVLVPRSPQRLKCPGLDAEVTQQGLSSRANPPNALQKPHFNHSVYLSSARTLN